jgi:hypothetical protein
MKYMRFMLTLCALAASVSGGALAQMMGGHRPPVPMTPGQFSQAVAGQNVQIAVRIERVKRSTLFAEMLEHKTDTVSKATGKHVVLYFADGTPVVMGSESDIVPGAVLFVYGIVTKPGNVDVKRAVVDTKYVKVQ